jgi:hypothetical protein
MKNRLSLFLTLSLGMILVYTGSGCTIVQSFMPTETPTLTPTPLPTNTPLPTPTVTPTPTEVPFFVDATVMSLDQQVPILIYHRFIPDRVGPTTSMKMQLSEFKNELELFYEHGFTLVSLYDWVRGTSYVPPGRRPLILTIDDVWYGDTLFINDDGSLSDLSALGILYDFYQEHPDFGYHAAVFAIYGDKYFAVKQVGDMFIGPDNSTWTTPSWRIKLGNTIAWAVEHGIEVYNHTLLHWIMTDLSNKDIQDQLFNNDLVLRELLSEAEREDVIPRLKNIIALPEGKWPSSQSGKNVVLNYKDPEGKPVLAVMEAYNLDAAQFTPSYFSDKFNPFAIARITASPYFVQYIIQNIDVLPPAQACTLGPLKQEQEDDPAVLQEQILNALNTGACTEGVYHVNGLIFIAQAGAVTPHTGAQINP